MIEHKWFESDWLVLCKAEEALQTQFREEKNTLDTSLRLNDEFWADIAEENLTTTRSSLMRIQIMLRQHVYAD